MMKMNEKRIRKLCESPCYKCNVQNQCEERVSKNYRLEDIRDNIFPRKDLSCKDCGIWVALNAEEIIEVDK